MTPLVKELVSLDPEVALSCIWFDLGTLPRYTFAWSELPGNRLPFEKCAIVGRDSKGDKFLVWAAQGDEYDEPAFDEYMSGDQTNFLDFQFDLKDEDGEVLDWYSDSIVAWAYYPLGIAQTAMKVEQARQAAIGA